MENSLIVSLAFLKINSDSYQNSYLDNFIPLLAEVLRNLQEPLISSNKVQEEMLRQFGLKIPLHVISALLNRARRKGYVKVEDHCYYKVDENLSGLSFQKNQSHVIRIYNALIDDYINFNLSKYNRTITKDIAENNFISFISYNQTKIIKGESDFVIFQKYPNLDPSEKVIISDYISNAQKSKPVIFEYIETIVKGHMIANSLYLPDTYNVNRKFQKTKIFFDTSLIIFALGYSGEEFRLPVRELINLLFTNGAQLCCFSHTVDEIRGILSAIETKLGKYDDTVFGRSVQYFTKQGYTPSDIKLLISSLNRRIESLRIKIVDKPSYSNHNYVIDEEKLICKLKSSFSNPRENTITRDIESIAGINQIRKGSSTYNIEDCRAILVTTNYSLVRLINEFYYENNDKASIPFCINDFALTNLVWLKTPNKAPDLPIQRVIADCYAAIQPKDELMEKWIKEINHLRENEDITAEDYYFLRYSNESLLTLSEVSLGNPDIITEGSIQEILEKAKKKIISEAQIEADNSNDMFKQLIDENKALIGENEDLQNITQNNERERNFRIRFKANNISKKIIKILRIISYIILVISFLLATINDISINFSEINIGNTTAKIVIWTSIVIMFIYNLLDNIIGLKLNAFLNQVELKLSNKIYEFIID